MKQKVIIFGRGRYFYSKSDEIKRNYEVVGFIDNSVGTGQTERGEEGYLIRNPEDLAEDKDNELPILLMSARFLEMYEQLHLLGFPDERILFGVSIRPAYDMSEKLLQERGICIKAERGNIVVLQEGNIIQKGDIGSYYEILRTFRDDTHYYAESIKKLPVTPMSRRFGLEYGQAIDRYYIENFLSNNSGYIKGDVLEVAENTYTERFKSGEVNSMELHVKGWGGHSVIKGNLETGEGIDEGMANCFICTQTIQFIFDIHRAVLNIHKLLKRGGVALITVAGIAQISMYDHNNWGEYWRLTDKSFKKLLSDPFGEDNIKVICYGNVKTATAFLYGLCVEDMDEEDFLYNDEQYPMLLAAVCKKN